MKIPTASANVRSDTIAFSSREDFGNASTPRQLSLLLLENYEPGSKR